MLLILAFCVALVRASVLCNASDSSVFCFLLKICMHPCKCACSFAREVKDLVDLCRSRGVIGLNSSPLGYRSAVTS